MNSDPLDLPTFTELADPSAPGRPGVKDTVKLKDTVKIDGKTKRPTPLEIDLERESTQNQRKADRVLADALMHLLSRLEHGRAQLEQLQGRQRPDQVLAVLADSVDQVCEAARQHLDAESMGSDLLRSVRQAADARKAAETFRQQLTLTLWQRIARCFGASAAQSAKRRKKFAQVLDRCVEAIGEFFLLFKLGFATAPAAQEWEQAASEFLAELKQHVAQLES